MAESKTGHDVETVELVTEQEARSAAQEVLVSERRVGERSRRIGAAYVFVYHPFAGVEGARELEGAPVTVTPLDTGHVRVQVAGITICSRAPVQRSGTATVDAR